MFSQLRKLIRKHPGIRMKLILIWRLFLHLIKSVSKLILASYSVYSRKIVDGLMEVHTDEGFRGYWVVGPAYVPVSLFRLIDDY